MFSLRQFFGVPIVQSDVMFPAGAAPIGSNKIEMHIINFNHINRLGVMSVSFAEA
jgi:hypothetical protein